MSAWPYPGRMADCAFEDLGSADLVLDATYRGGSGSSFANEPISPLFKIGERGVGNRGGFRAAGTKRDGYDLVVLHSTGDQVDWPDTLDRQTGLFTYFGDNRSPGQELHATTRGGNRILRDVFASVHSGEMDSPPFFLFESSGNSRDVVFLGLAAPGGPTLSSDEDLVAIWRTTEEKRFQNYRALFTVLDTGTVSREWLAELYAGVQLGEHCPDAWRRWKNTGVYTPLTAPSTTKVRTKAQQLPDDEEGRRILEAIHDHFSSQPTRFEHCAAAIWQMLESNASEIEVTRPTGDGGRDALGKHSLGPPADRVKVDFALEAKCYVPDAGVGVKEVSRLISRLLHRQYGVLVTTSYLGPQPYKEIRDDGHPVVIVSGRDIVEILRAKDLGSEDDVRHWLTTRFPVEAKASDSQ